MCCSKETIPRSGALRSWRCAGQATGTYRIRAGSSSLAGPGNRLGGWAARAALVAVLDYAAISAYWALGGTWLLTTVGVPLATNCQSVTLTLVVWAAVLLKAASALVPILACRPDRRSTWHRGSGRVAGFDSSKGDCL